MNDMIKLGMIMQSREDDKDTVDRAYREMEQDIAGDEVDAVLACNMKDKHA